MRNISSRKLNAGLVALAAFSSVLVTGCSSEGIVDASEVSGEKNIELNVAIGKSNTSRSVTGDLLTNTFSGGESIDILYTTSSTTTSGNVGSYMIDTDGTSLQSPGLSIPVNSTDTRTYYFYSVFPSGVWTPDESETADLSSTASFTVQANQSSDEDYAKSDLMLATTTASTSYPKGTLTFRHCLSRIVVKSLTYTLNGVDQDVSKAKITLSSRTGAVSTSTWKDLCQEAEGAEFIADTNSEAVYIVLKDEDNPSTHVAAIIPPCLVMDIPTRTAFRVELNGSLYTATRGDIDYLLGNDASFEAGKEYIFNLKIVQNTVEAELAGVRSWESGNVEGEEETGADLIM